jgi:hypothetical protein
VLKSEKILLVEGKDEVDFFEALFSFMEISDYQIINAGGKDNFKTYILSLKTI